MCKIQEGYTYPRPFVKEAGIIKGTGTSTAISSEDCPLCSVVVVRDQTFSAIFAGIKSTLSSFASSFKNPISKRPFHHQSNSKELSHSNRPTQDQRRKRKSQDLKEYCLEEVSEHYSHNDCWIILFDKIYDVTHFLSQHPGGDFIILESAGRDATLAFRGSRHGRDSYDSLSEYLIGILPKSERMYSDEERDEIC
jgi:cytochrome b involved in lipid metabolism